ncbi:hypothetical protein, partial [Polaromonas sp.]|uniref:hypothetical protein n=1 Tax=Polaromonas sp. TaxID=1869339 RepID=UPI002735D1D4
MKTRQAPPLPRRDLPAVVTQETTVGKSLSVKPARHPNTGAVRNNNIKINAHPHGTLLTPVSRTKKAARKSAA